MNDFQEHHIPGAETVVVAWASGGGEFGAGLPHFEFGNMLKTLGVSHALMRDSTGRWFTKGVHGLGDQKAVLVYLQCLKDTYDRVVSIGLSSGAYAALLYGQLANVTETIAISPITGLGDVLKAEVDPKWHHRVDLPADFPFPIDLKPTFPGGPNHRLLGYVSDGDGAELDVGMFERLLRQGGLAHTHATDDGWVRQYDADPNASLTMIRGFTHSELARGMRDSGQLARIIRGDP